MPVEPPCAAFPPRGRRHCSYLVGRSPRQPAKRDTARMAASTRGSRIICGCLWNISLEAGVRAVSPHANRQKFRLRRWSDRYLLHHGDFVCRKTANFGVRADNGLVFGKIDAEGLIIGNITLDPLDVGAKLTQHFVRFCRRLAQLLAIESSDLWDIAFDDEFL